MSQQLAHKPVSLWRNRNFLLLMGGYAISALGTGISQLALPLLILAQFHSPPAAALNASLQWLPYIILGLPAGALVDRWNRKHVMLLSNLGLLLCIGSIPLALLLHILTLPHIYIVSLLTGAFTIFYQLGEVGTFTTIVSKEQMSTAVAQDEMIYSSVSLLSPSLGGMLFGLGKIFPFLTDMLSYGVMILSILGIRVSGTPNETEHMVQKRHLLAEVWEGIRWLWEHHLVRLLVLLTSYFYMLMNASILFVVLLANSLHLSSFITGILVGCGGLGNVLGTLLCPLLQKRIRSARLLRGTVILFVLLWPLYALIRSPLLICLLIFCISIADSVSAILMSSYRLSAIPNNLQGRVGSVSRLLFYGVLAAGQAGVALCLRYFQLSIAVYVLWAGLLVCAVSVFFSQDLKRLDSLQKL